MPGNRQVYEQSMNNGHSAAWDQDWQTAVANYGRAIVEFPDDAEAHLHLGLGLLEIGRLDDALKVYQRAHQLAPQDPIPLEKSADVLERMGRLREAAQQYVNVAEIYLTQRDLNKAIDNWERATDLTPGLVPVHAKLAQAYERIGDKKKAIHEYLALAYNFQRTNDYDRAIKAAQRALKIDKNNAQVLNTLRALESGGRIMPPQEDGTRVAARQNSFDKDQKRAKVAANAAFTEGSVESDPFGPIGEGMRDSMGTLAIYVMEGTAGDATGDLLAGMEAQRQGLADQAIEAYMRAESRIDHPALRLNLGGLMIQRDRNEEALKRLDKVVGVPQMTSAALHGMGQAYLKLGKHRQAIDNMLRTLQSVDETMNIDPDHAIDLIGMWRELREGIVRENDEVQQRIAKRLGSFLEGKEWRTSLRESRRQIEETIREQGIKGELDILAAERGDKLTESVTLIDRYMRQGLFVLAMDEAHRAVEFSPTYLPVHIRMAEIMMREGRVRQAIQKYNAVAKTFMARGENDRAMGILAEVLERAPLDIAVRESLIELLESEERWDEVLDQYIDLADAHHQLGNFEQSRDTYALAERIATKVNASSEKIVRIKHRLADIDLTRLDLRRVQKTYEEIIALAPEDERAHRMLVDLNYRQGNAIEAIRRLDKLLGIYARLKQVNRIVQLLEELVTVYPQDTGLRSRLASIYKQLQRRVDAIKQLDALGELQLQAGNHREAAGTIRQIIALNPDRMDDYRKLLAQLGG
ncbi:MAG: tetratricopeptide repeat protein [Pleurocapsa minor GSE-CHR-MK-17-07R]|jgi:tetratricopeptide (TPR) repeat protein|nr:tetratricopeptide repeat protein [Pleurocapsa minor GSE-CHR-MK 17-07R]